MADLNVTYEDIAASAKKLRSGKADIEQQLTALKREIDGLVKGGFVTQKASGAFEASYTEFNTGITKAIEGLEGMSSYLDGASSAMSEVDEKLAQAIQK